MKQAPDRSKSPDYANDDDPDGQRFLLGLVNGLAISLLIIAVFYGLWIIAP